MNTTLLTADQGTHLRILVTAMMAATAFVMLSLATSPVADKHVAGSMTIASIATSR